MARLECYEERDKILRKLGYKSYSSYLRSELWKKIRDRVLDAAGRVCSCCGSKATQVHHKSYSKETMLGLDDSCLVALAAKCHRAIEYKLTKNAQDKIRREKVNLAEANWNLVKREQKPARGDRQKKKKNKNKKGKKDRIKEKIKKETASGFYLSGELRGITKPAKEYASFGAPRNMPTFTSVEEEIKWWSTRKY